MNLFFFFPIFKWLDGQPINVTLLVILIALKNPILTEILCFRFLLSIWSPVFMQLFLKRKKNWKWKTKMSMQLATCPGLCLVSACLLFISFDLVSTYVCPARVCQSGVWVQRSDTNLIVKILKWLHISRHMCPTVVKPTMNSLCPFDTKIHPPHFFCPIFQLKRQMLEF